MFEYKGEKSASYLDGSSNLFLGAGGLQQQITFTFLNGKVRQRVSLNKQEVLV